jgi:hypothetical protein
MNPLIKTQNSDCYGQVRFRLVAVLDSFDLLQFLKSKGFPDDISDSPFRDHHAGTLAKAMSLKDSADVKHNLIKLINTAFPTHKKLWCKNQWSFALFVPVLEDNKDWDGSNTLYAEGIAKLNRPVRGLPIGVKQRDVENFFKKYSEFFPSYSFSSEEEILAYLNRNYGVE